MSSAPQRPDLPEGSQQSAPSNCSLSGFGSEILIAQWEARADQCEKTAEQFRTMTMCVLASYLEKARAYRQCVQDLRRQVGHEDKRQPTENDALCDGGPQSVESK